VTSYTRRSFGSTFSLPSLRPSFLSRARAEDTTVNIDNFTFEPKVTEGEGRHHRDLDKPGRHPPVVSAGKFRSKTMAPTAPTRSHSRQRAITSIFVRCIRI